MATFALHPQLAADGLFLVDWPLTQVLRMNDAAYPWLILVPRLTDAREIIDLSAADRVRLMDEIAWASHRRKYSREPKTRTRKPWSRAGGSPGRAPMDRNEPTSSDGLSYS